MHSLLDLKITLLTSVTSSVCVRNCIYFSIAREQLITIAPLTSHSIYIAVATSNFKHKKAHSTLWDVHTQKNYIYLY